MKAVFGSICRSCGQDIVAGQEIVPRRGDFIHASCAPGQDDE